MAQIDFSARGNAVGFTAKGEVITGRKMKGGKTSDWAVEIGEHFQLTNGMRRTFAKKPDAIAYAASLIDSAKTVELAWWN